MQSQAGGASCGKGNMTDVWVGYTVVVRRACSSGFVGDHCVSWSPNSDHVTSMTQTFDIQDYGPCDAGGPQAGVYRGYTDAAKQISELPASGKFIQATVNKSGNVRRSVAFLLYSKSGSAWTWTHDIIINYGSMSWSENRGTNLAIPGLPGKWKIRIDDNPLGVKRISLAPTDVSNRTYLSVDYCKVLKWLRDTKQYASNHYVKRLGITGEASYDGVRNTGNATWTGIRIDGY
jgi:hypothetical protein